MSKLTIDEERIQDVLAVICEFHEQGIAPRRMDITERLREMHPEVHARRISVATHQRVSWLLIRKYVNCKPGKEWTGEDRYPITDKGLRAVVQQTAMR